MKIKLVFNLLVLVFGFLLFVPVSLASSTQTTIYLSSMEKNLESGDMRIYYSAGNAVAVRNIRSGVSSITYLHSDFLGGTSVVTKSDGGKESSFTYYPFGNETTNLNLTSTDKFYTGQRKDVSSDLYFYNARYYNPKIGHFISADKARGGNRYAYVSNNPIMLNDPSGLTPGSGEYIPLILKGIEKDTILKAFYRGGRPGGDIDKELREYLARNPNFSWNDPVLNDQSNGDPAILRVHLIGMMMEKDSASGQKIKIGGYMAIGFAGAVSTGGPDDILGGAGGGPSALGAAAKNLFSRFKKKVPIVSEETSSVEVNTLKGVESELPKVVNTKPSSVQELFADFGNPYNRKPEAMQRIGRAWDSMSPEERISFFKASREDAVNSWGELSYQGVISQRVFIEAFGDHWRPFAMK